MLSAYTHTHTHESRIHMMVTVLLVLNVLFLFFSSFFKFLLVRGVGLGWDSLLRNRREY